MEDTKSTVIKQYSGNCHCGRFKFSVRLPELTAVRSCGCAICTRKAYLWIIPLADETLVWESKGKEGELNEYEFADKYMNHKFCPKCGSAVLGRIRSAPPNQALGINARMLRNHDLDSLEQKPLDEGKLAQPFQAPSFPVPPVVKDDQESDEKLQIYNGCCHCDAVSFSLSSKPLSKSRIISCNCSLCSRNGELWIYPPASAVSVHGLENLTEYAFLSKESLHCFCKICGIPVLVKVLGEGTDLMPINIRTLEPSVNIENLNVKKYDGKSNGPQYVV